MSTVEMKKFEGWETALDPDTLCLLSILNFQELGYHIKNNHLSNEAEFCFESEEQCASNWKQANLSKSGVNPPNKNRILPDGTALPTPPQSNFTPPSGPDGIVLPIPLQSDFTPLQSDFIPQSNSDKVTVSSQVGSILPDASDSDEVSFPSSRMTFDDDDDDEPPDFDSFISSVPTNTQKWDLPSGKSVNEIYFVNVSQCAEVLKKKEILSPVERATLRYGMSKIIDLSAHMRDWFSDIDIQHMTKDHVTALTVPALDEEVNAFIADVEKVHLQMTDLGEWEFSAHCTNAKAIGDRCRSARVNQSILNAILRLNLTKEQVNKTRIPFLQISGVYGQMLLEDLINDFYVVFPGITFEIPTKLAHIKKLKSTEMYEEVDGMLYELDHGYNSLNQVFNVKVVNGSSHYKTNFIHDPWWTPKKNVSSQLMIAFEEMESKQG
ncbi:17035_t:CDS:2 [Racocetra fulgida]|uniref:17035_t:CDS:1 n=1 Tax=Racocetra fulgida TaxID=60492 RepID=A0A9N9A7E8_9GLOM|nr:17035_t:CDS:2 [Racocetra fulgida]